MGVTFDQVTVTVPGAAKSSFEGTLAIADGELAFREIHAENRGDEAVLFTWRVPRLTDGPEGPVLRVFTLLGATAIQVGPLERLAMITLRGIEREHVERTLADNGYPAVVQALTLAASELSSLRNWGFVFIIIGLTNADSGLAALTGFGMFAVGVWSLFAGPRAGILAANGLLLLALAAKNMQQNGAGFWPVVLGILGFRQLQRWAELKPLLANPVHAAWVRGKLFAPHDEASEIPAGYPGRTIAFLLSTAFAAFALLFLIPVFTSLGAEVRSLPPAMLLLALSAWYLLVTVYPRIAARAARRVLPSAGPVAVLFFPFIIVLCLLVLVASLMPPPASP